MKSLLSVLHYQMLSISLLPLVYIFILVGFIYMVIPFHYLLYIVGILSSLLLIYILYDLHIHLHDFIVYLYYYFHILPIIHIFLISSYFLLFCPSLFFFPVPFILLLKILYPGVHPLLLLCSFPFYQLPSLYQ